MANQADWQFSNLQLQKLVYLCQLFHLGHVDGKPLFHEYFEAWDYGPVVPVLYHELKMFGANKVRRYSGLPTDADFSSSEETKRIVDRIVVLGMESTPGYMIQLTHQKGGAWERHYQREQSNIIPQSHILAEYKTLFSKNKS